MYQQRLRELEGRQTELINENEELKQLCLYLDEQRQRSFVYRTEDDRESEDLGCGSSERSEDCDETKDLCETPSINQQKENTLRMISQRIGSFAMNQVPSSDSIAHTERLVDYIQSLEERIKQLEGASRQNGIWHSACTLGSDSDERTVIDRCEELSNDVLLKKCRLNDPKAMQISHCSTLTTSGTTYASSETDLESAVYVMGDESDCVDDTLEVRSLTRIEEDSEGKENPSDEVEEQSAQLPPAIAPLSESLLNVSRLSLDDAKSAKSLDLTVKSTSPALPLKTSFREFNSNSQVRRPRPLTGRISLLGAAKKASERSVAECGAV
ncbi:hypothetical protein COOONC_21026 [Cooperia oncophora]